MHIYNVDTVLYYCYILCITLYINKSIATTGVSFLRGSSRSKVLPVFAALQLFGTPNPPGPLATAAAPGSPSDADAAARLHRRSWAPKWASHCSW